MLTTLMLKTGPKDNLTDLTAQILEVIAGSGVRDGVCVITVPHTTAGITLNSMLDETTPLDIINDLNRLVPRRVDFLHQYDTPGDAAGHIKAALIGHSVNLIISDGRALLGGSQSILFYEFDGPRQRKVYVKILEG